MCVCVFCCHALHNIQDILFIVLHPYFLPASCFLLCDVVMGMCMPDCLSCAHDLKLAVIHTFVYHFRSGCTPTIKTSSNSLHLPLSVCVCFYRATLRTTPETCRSCDTTRFCNQRESSPISSTSLPTSVSYTHTHTCTHKHATRLPPRHQPQPTGSICQWCFQDYNSELSLWLGRYVK